MIPASAQAREPAVTPPQDEAIPLRAMVRMALRTLPFLGTVRRDVRRLIRIGFVLGLVAIPIAMMISDVLLNRLLGGKPLTAPEAALYMLDRARFVDVPSLSTAAREVLRNRMVAYLIGSTLVVVPIALYLSFYGIGLVQRINQALRSQMMTRVQAMSMRFHASSRVGDAIYHAYQDSATVTSLMGMLVQPLIPLVRATYLCAMLLLFDYRLSLLVLALYGASLLLGRWYGPRLRSRFRLAREKNSALTSRIQETLSAIKVIKAYGAQGHEQKRFDTASLEAFEAAYSARTSYVLYTVLAFVLTAMPALIAACAMALFAAEGRPIAAAAALSFTGFAVWNLGAYTYALGRVDGATSASNALLTMWGGSQDLVVGMERSFSQTDLALDVKEAKDALALTGISQSLAFRNVSFAYDSERAILTDVDLVVVAGSITALVGPTGSGKSTMVSLLLRLFDPDRGHIEIDGHDIRNFTLESLRSNVAIALQENLLFSTTIRENIRYAVPDATDEQVRAAARVACADTFIDALPDGYDTMLGERGTKLSTGQRQRLSIARAVIKNAPVLILDEPTAALDADTELQVIRSLGEWGKSRAILLITHRLSTIRRVDRIAYLRDGRLIEQGTPAELAMQEGGAYRRFLELEREPSASTEGGAA
jgi:ABC-type multidrug transport system fused ATPase/permease subunit